MIEGFADSDKEERSRPSFICLSIAVESDPFQGMNKYIQTLAKDQNLRGEPVSRKKIIRHIFYNSKDEIWK